MSAVHEVAEAPPKIGLRPLTGNEAIARGAWEAGVKVAAAYPGTPSTEILESLATYPAHDLHAQWSTNEKVALDVAIGASFAGSRAFAAMKHVGLNVAADAFMSQAYIGVNGGLVIAVADDPGIHSSQNEQDSRFYGQFAAVPVLEPSDAQEALEFTRFAFELSEQFDTMVIVRTTTRLSHTRSAVKLGTRNELASRGFVENRSKNVMIPAHARPRHLALIEREAALQRYLRDAPIHRWERRDAAVGVITAGTCYPYVREALPGASVLKLGASWPLSGELLREFCASVERVFVVEELEPFIEREMRTLGLAVDGKAFFPRSGEFSPELLRAGFERAGVLPPQPPRTAAWAPEPIVRPPVLCAGCPHTSTYLAVRATGARVAGDIGCYTLAALDPLRGIDTSVAMGSSIGVATGMAKAGEPRPVMATIGDSTFLHAGIPALIDAVYNDANITVMLLDNHITAMTGGQDHAGTGKTLRGEAAPRVDYEALLRAIGVKWIRKVDSYDLAAMNQTLREAIAHRGVSVVISDRPCVIDPVKIKGPPLAIDEHLCNACQSCMNLGCPAMTWGDTTFEGRHKVQIDPALCVGCTLCAQVCTVDCIKPPAALQRPLMSSSDPMVSFQRGGVDQAVATPCNVLIVGVGGQGVILVSKVLAALAQSRGLQVKQSEVHGMAKRGGSVFSHVRFGPQVWSPTIPRGEVDVLVALEWAEGLRWLPWLRPGSGIFVCDTKRVVPPFACLNRRPGAPMRYARETPAEVREHVAEGYAIDATVMAEALGNERVANVVLLGALSIALDFPVADWQATLAEFVPRKTVDVNRQAFAEGRAWIERARNEGPPVADTAPPAAVTTDVPVDVRLEITPAWCKSCDICVKLCPERCLRLNDERVAELIDPALCTGCRLCEWLCPDFAIRVHLDARPTPAGALA
ncbi:MAG: indolepyruvate ferredoxin oxidoreductase subunit alpha [Ideonella sp.]|nr:indolepyruvate ferredoxin oxidoreductase subunit alpha [Ideonella sp.]